MSFAENLKELLDSKEIEVKELAHGTGISKNTLDNYGEEPLKFYDFSFFLKWEGEESDIVITGNKHHNMDSIAWISS